MNKQSFIPDPIYIVGLSGGPDSVFLLYRLIETNPNTTFVAAYLDHEWRKGSDKDAEFCAELCKKLNVEFITKKASELTLEIKDNGSQEEVGRKLRRHFFEMLMLQYNAQGIILGHHADDQLETFFIRLVRGTTSQGLACMKEQDGFYIRPLLDIPKQEILDWLKEQNISYLEDVTNYSDKYLRNRIRKDIIPAFKSVDPRAADNFSRSLEQLQQAESFLEEITEYTLESLLDEQHKLDLKAFFNVHPYIKKRVLQRWLTKQRVAHTLTNSFLDEILKFLESPRGGSHQLGQDWKLIKKQNKVYFG